MTPRAPPLVCLALGLVLVASRVSAQRADAEREADGLARAGLTARREGRDADALTSFQRALALSPRVSLRAQVGFAMQALGRWAEAERELDAVLHAADPWTARHRATLEAALFEVRARLGWLVVSVEPSGCEVRIEGEPATSGEVHRRPVGTVAVSARCADHYPVERVAQVRAGETSRETITLRPRAPEPTPPSASPVVTVTAPPVILATPAPAAPPRWFHWVGPTALAGVGAAALGVGAGLAVARDNALATITASGCVETSTEYVCTAGTADITAARAAHDEATSRSAASVAMLTVGSGLVVAGAAWILVMALQRPAVTRAVTFVPGGVRCAF